MPSCPRSKLSFMGGVAKRGLHQTLQNSHIQGLDTFSPSGSFCFSFQCSHTHSGSLTAFLQTLASLILLCRVVQQNEEEWRVFLGQISLKVVLVNKLLEGQRCVWACPQLSLEERIKPTPWTNISWVYNKASAMKWWALSLFP